jgi:dTDP-4-dehydrorhamnose 3,5-epimerase
VFTAVQTAIEDVVVFEPRVFPDARGFFLECFNERDLAVLGLKRCFVQQNQSRSIRGVVRGLHYQLIRPQGKLLHVTRGAIFDVAVDIRRGSPSFGKHVSVELNDENHRVFWVPEGFAHGFQVLSETVDLTYMATDYYEPEGERSIRWNDPELAIQWPLAGMPLLSPKDKRGKLLREAEVFD